VPFVTPPFSRDIHVHFLMSRTVMMAWHQGCRTVPPTPVRTPNRASSRSIPELHSPPLLPTSRTVLPPAPPRSLPIVKPPRSRAVPEPLPNLQPALPIRSRTHADDPRNWHKKSSFFFGFFFFVFLLCGWTLRHF
jgi:hypothetical protein